MYAAATYFQIPRLIGSRTFKLANRSVKPLSNVVVVFLTADDIFYLMVVGTCSMALGIVAIPVSGLPLEVLRADIFPRKDDVKIY